MISSRLVRPIAALVGWPVARLGGASGGLARQNAVRNPSRTAATAAALMVGLALVTFVSVLGTGLLDTTEKGVERQVAAGYVVSSTNGWDPLPPAVGRAVASSPEAGDGQQRPPGLGARRGLAAGRRRRRPGHDRLGLPLRLGAGLGRVARHAGRRRRDRRDLVRRGPRPGDRLAARHRQPLGRRAPPHGDRRLRPAAALVAAGHGADLAARPSTRPSRGRRTSTPSRPAAARPRPRAPRRSSRR